MRGATLAVLAIGLAASPAVHAQVAPCSAVMGGSAIYLLDTDIASCATMIGASSQDAVRVGEWGGNLIQVDGQANVWVNGVYAGVLVNPSGTVGSLSDRCFAGDVAACQQYQRQMDAAIEQYEAMYPDDWFDAARIRE
ncbi:MAG: hypothetical protein ACK4YP_10745 [Myxococcota bacterium]